jgi:hypothetical protein
MRCDQCEKIEDDLVSVEDELFLCKECAEDLEREISNICWRIELALKDNEG